MKEIVENIKKNALSDLIKSSIPALIICGIGLVFLYSGFNKGFNIKAFILAIITLFFGFGFLSVAIKNIKLLVNPFNSDVFKKYGDIDEIERIYQEIENTIEIEEGDMIISENYITDRNVVEKLVATKDILAVHKLVHKTNFTVDYYKLIITDKYGKEIHFIFNKDEEKTVNNLITIIGKKSPNAVLGYSQNELNHIKNNKISLGDNLKDKPYSETTSNSNSIENKANTLDKCFTIKDFACGITEMCIKELIEIVGICTKNSVDFDEKKLIISTFAYFYTIWLISFGNITLRQSDIVENIYKEKFKDFNRKQFEDEPFKTVIENENLLNEKLKSVDRRVRTSYHENNKTFVDDGISDEYILEFILDKNDKDKIKPEIVIKILKDWASKAITSGKELTITD